MSSLAIMTNPSFEPAAKGRAYAIAAPFEVWQGQGKAAKSMPVMLAVTLAHMAALGWMLHSGEAKIQQVPVLAFSVTMMDFASSPNTISTAASSAAAPEEKPEPRKNVEQVTPEARVAKPKKAVKPVPAPVAHTQAPQAHNSQQQTAVLAPVTPAQFDAAYLQNPAPSYPALSRRMGEQGKVLLTVFVNENGQPETVKLKQSSGFDRLDNAAVDAVKRWRFAAARQGEQMLASWVQVPVNFILE